MRRIACMAAGLFLACAFSACDPRAPETVALPADNLAALEPAVREALAAARARFDAAATAKPERSALALSWGELGMAYHAQDLHGQAEISYRNAALLAPSEARWRYLRGVALRDAGRLDEAITEFETALRLAPDAATRIHLGRALLEAGRPDAARSQFEEAGKVASARAASLAGIGKVELAKGNAREAVNAFEESLRLWPTASRLHQPLAMAYRSLNDEAKAAEHLRQHVANGLEPGFEDPHVEQVRNRTAGARVHLARGARASAAGRLDLAEAAYRDAIKADPRNSEARSNLGAVLANQGRDADARAALEEAVRLDERNANAQFGLGLLYDRQGVERLARDHYERAVALDARNVRARLFLADAHMRDGHPEAAIPLYREALAANPPDPVARNALAMALARDRKWRDARAVLEEGFDGTMQDAARVNALARILAAAPDSAARDAARALALARRLFEATRAPEAGQTFAMAMAESGDFDRAASLQRATLAIAGPSGAWDPRAFVQANLALYERRKPAREPWPENHPEFNPSRVQASARTTAASSR